MTAARDVLRQTLILLAAAGFFAAFPNVSTGATLVVHNEHTGASDENVGSEAAPLKTIQRAALLAQPGDTVLVHGGVYRERVAPARGGTPGQPIVYAAAPGESVVIKGSEVWQPMWRKMGDQHPIYAGRLDAAMFRGERIHPFRTSLKGMPDGKRLTLGQVFVDGRPLREVDKAADLATTPASWRIDESGTDLILHFPPGEKPPDQRLVEVTVRQRIFAPHRRGLGYIHVHGFTMEHCANQFPDQFWQSDSPQAGALGCRAGHHWQIEANTIRFAKSIGLDCGYEGRDLEGNQPTPQNPGYHLIRNNHVVDNGCCGIAGMRSTATKIIGNTIERNNWNHHLAPEAAGIKVHLFVGGLISGNLVRDNDAHGIWLDNVYRNSRVSQNVVVGNRGSAIFVELGQGPVLIDNNVLAETRPDFNADNPRAEGIYTHDASGVQFVHNLVFGCDHFGALHRKMTNRPKAGASRILLRNNLFIDNQTGHLNLPYPGPDSQDNFVDHNVFSANGEYLVNPWGGTPSEKMMRSVTTITGIRPETWNNTCPRLSLAQWQNVHYGWFQNVAMESLAASLSPDLVLTLELDRMPLQHESKRVEEVRHDYFGEPLPADIAIAGPFQRLTVGPNRLPLWPRANGNREGSIGQE